MNGFYESFTKELNPDWNIHFMITEPAFVQTDYLTQSIVVTERHPAYVNDAKCGTNQVLTMLEQAKQGAALAGTPALLAEIVVEVVERGASEGVEIPLRLPLGPESAGLIDASLKKQLTENEAVTPFAERFVGAQGKGFEGFEDMV
jgi:hypothetical protein